MRKKSSKMRIFLGGGVIDSSKNVENSVIFR